MDKTNNSDGIFSNAEFNRFGLITMILLIVGCLGGFAVGMGGIEEIWSLVLIVVPTMTTLSLLLAVAPMKYIMSAGAVAVVIDLLFIAYFLLT